jgi:hypothetical protein
MFKTGAAMIDAEHAFTRARRGARLRRLRRARVQLPVYETAAAGVPVAGGIREIPLDAISGTLAGRRRWERIWIAEERGALLPPIAVVPVCGGGYAVRDGHHRVSVARARGAVAIDATVGV